MKITAVIPDDLIKETRKYSGGSTIAESLRIVLGEYVSRQRLLRTTGKVRKRPLLLRINFTAEKVRKTNREGHLTPRVESKK